MGNWGISPNATPEEKVKSEMADFLHGLNSTGQIDYHSYNAIFDFSMTLLDKMHELGKNHLSETSTENKFKQSIEYLIAINGDEKQVSEKNEKCGTVFKSTEEHYDTLMDKVENVIHEVGDQGGWYIGDGIRVKVEVEYEPENK